MRWPRGKYNGRRITGFRVSFEFSVIPIFWRPRISWNFGEPYIIWLVFYLRGYCVYTARDEQPK